MTRRVHHGWTSVVRVSVLIVVAAVPVDVGLASPGPGETRRQLPQQGPSSNLARCQAGLAAGHSAARSAAAECLAGLGPAAAPAIPALIDALADFLPLHWDGIGPDGRPAGGRIVVRDDAILALERIGEASIVPLIDALARHRDVRVREGAAQAMATIVDPRFTEPLIAALADEAAIPDVRLPYNVLRTAGATRVCDRAARTLADLRDPAVGDALVARLNDPSGPIREGVLAVLVSRNDSRVVSPVRQRLADRNRDVRVSAVRHIAVINPPDLVDVLIRALADADFRVRTAAIEALSLHDYVSRPETAASDEQRALEALEAVERAARAAYAKRPSLDAGTIALMHLAERAFDAKRTLIARRAGR